MLKGLPILIKILEIEILILKKKNMTFIKRNKISDKGTLDNKVIMMIENREIMREEVIENIIL